MGSETKKERMIELFYKTDETKSKIDSLLSAYQGLPIAINIELLLHIKNVLEENLQFLKGSYPTIDDSPF